MLTPHVVADRENPCCGPASDRSRKPTGPGRGADTGNYRGSKMAGPPERFQPHNADHEIPGFLAVAQLQDPMVETSVEILQEQVQQCIAKQGALSESSIFPGQCSAACL